MKELYIRPELDIEIFKTEDIITASVENEGNWKDEWAGNGAALIDEDKSR